jgi:hypothetical protein
MKETLRQWLEELPAVQGVLACGLRFPDRSSVNRSWSSDFQAGTLDNLWRCVGDTFDVARLHQLPDRRLRWVFSRLALHCEKRADGVVLGLVTERELRSDEASTLAQMMADFHLVG